MSDEQKSHNPFDTLVDQIHLCLSIAESKTIQVFAQALQERGVRVILAAVCDNPGMPPQVEVTVTPDDVTSEVVAQVVNPILRHAGVPEDKSFEWAAMAGGMVTRAYKRYRAGRERPQQHAGPKAPGTWDPSARRRRWQT